jgi:dimethylhistidine N-methyltransferase
MSMSMTHSIIQQDHSLDQETLRRQFAHDVLKGLSQQHKSIPCKYIYDERGSELFCNIMELPEYYLTGCEKNSLDAHKGVISDTIGRGHSNLIELGAGDGMKTKILIRHLLERDHDFQYCPIDISESAVVNLSQGLNRKYPGLKIKGLVTDYFQGLTWLSQQNNAQNIVLFLGSNIGNFPPREAMDFLKHLRKSINTGDYLLIGFDLKKDIDVMVKAYNDAQGVTEQFIVNILSRINRELGGEFDLDCFRYFSTWDDLSGAIKSYLVSTCDQKVHIRNLNTSFTFNHGEVIHTESSYKFTPEQCSVMAEEAGFEIVENYFDNRNYFVDSLWIAI